MHHIVCISSCSRLVSWSCFPSIQDTKNDETLGIKVTIPNDMMESALSKHDGDREKAERWCLQQIYSEMTDSVAQSFISALDDAKSMQLNRICYCQRSLKQLTTGAADSAELLCRSCWRFQSLSEAYGCNNEQCVFKERMEMEFRICPSCYNTTNQNDEKEDDSQRTPIERKTTASLSIIS